MIRRASVDNGTAVHRSCIRGALIQAQFRLPGAVAQLVDDLGHGRVTEAIQAALTADPQLTDMMMWGLAAGGIGPSSISALYPDGHPVVTARGTPPGPAAPPPRSIADLLEGTARTYATRVDGDVDVHILTGVDAAGRPTRKVIVDIPGTGDWNVAKFDDTDVTGLGTSTRAMSGQSTTYEQGVLTAMREAGVRSDDDVLLVGHSQGALVAVNAARDAVASGQFNVTHVISAGGPIGAIVGAVPRSVQVLALENDGDLVPEVDGRLNPDRRNVTTATVHENHHDVLANHDLRESYIPGASDVEASKDPSLLAYRAGLNGFLTADDVDSQRFGIRRAL
jgi:pimeloyl-ACP methyl ester carboxylesterase